MIMATVMLAVVSMISLASALGVSYSYYKDHPLLLAPGESANVPVNIQNLVGGEDVSVVMKITQGNEIASTSSTIYLLKAGTADTFSNVRIEIPSDAVVGKQYQVTLVLSTVNADTSGQMISVGTAIETSFPVKIIAAKVRPASPESESKIGWIVGLVVVLLVFWIAFRMMNKKKRK